MADEGLEIVATHGTAEILNKNNIKTTAINKVTDGQPHIVDAMINGEIDLVFNTTSGAQALKDSFSLRETALLQGIPYYTTVAGCKSAALAIRALKKGKLEVMPLQGYFK